MKDKKMPQDKAKSDLPPIVREVPDPPVPNRAHTEMKKDPQEKQKG